MNRKMIGEVIYIRVSDRKYNPIATKRGNVPTQSWRGKSYVELSDVPRLQQVEKSRRTAEESRTSSHHDLQIAPGGVVP